MTARTKGRNNKRKELKVGKNEEHGFTKDGQSESDFSATTGIVKVK